MAGNLIGEPFRSYVNEQIKARQEIHGKTNRTTKEIQYLNSRNAWIKLASAVFVEQKRLDLLEGNPLLNGIHKGQDLAINNVSSNDFLTVAGLSSTICEKSHTGLPSASTSVNKLVFGVVYIIILIF